MALIRQSETKFVVELTAKEMNLITRALAYMGGYCINPRDSDIVACGILNRALLKARQTNATQELKIIDDALQNVEESQENENRSVSG